MGIADRLSEEADRLGLRWGAEGVREKAAAVAKTIAARADKEPLVALSLVQALAADPGSATFFERPSVKFLRESIRKQSEVLGEGDLPRWVQVMALVALENVKGDKQLLWKLAPPSNVLTSYWEWKAPELALGKDSSWADVSAAVDALPEPPKSAVAKLHGRVGAVYAATQRFAGAWSPPIHMLWWAQAEWSEPYRRPWSNLPENGRGALLVAEFASIAPASDAAVNFLLKTLRDQDVALGEARPIAEWIARTVAARAWGQRNGLDLIAEPPPGLVEQLAAEPTGLPIYAAILGHAPKDEPDVSGLAFYRRLAEELLLIRHVFGG